MQKFSAIYLKLSTMIKCLFSEMQQGLNICMSINFTNYITGLRNKKKKSTDAEKVFDKIQRAFIIRVL